MTAFIRIVGLITASMTSQVLGANHLDAADLCTAWHRNPRTHRRRAHQRRYLSYKNRLSPVHQRIGLLPCARRCTIQSPAEHWRRPSSRLTLSLLTSIAWEVYAAQERVANDPAQNFRCLAQEVHKQVRLPCCTGAGLNLARITPLTHTECTASGCRRQSPPARSPWSPRQLLPMIPASDATPMVAQWLCSASSTSGT